jgi:hypothetical protein
VTPPDVREVVRKLKQRPGRGGVRLSYQEAELVLGMLRAGGLSVARERRRRTHYQGALRALLEEHAS